MIEYVGVMSKAKTKAAHIGVISFSHHAMSKSKGGAHRHAGQYHTKATT
jgi:hypothetical protein